MTISRRRCLAVAAAALAAGPAVAEKVLEVGNAVEQHGVVIVGSGLAGLSAAAGALENGADSVLILEKGPLVGGHSQYSSGSIAAVLPKAMQPAQGWQDSVEQFVADALAVGEGLGNADLLVKIASDSYDALMWLQSCGIYYGPVFTAKSGVHPRCYAMPGNSAGRSYVLALARHVRTLGAAVRLNSRVTDFERVANGWLVRVEQTKESRRIHRTILAKSLVIASGGFTADIARRMKIDRRLTADVHTSANPYGTVWDGADAEVLSIAQSIGAAVTDRFGLQLLPYWGGRLLDYDGGDIYVDSTGQRFVNEALPWNAVADKILNLENRSCWVITDARSHKGATLGLKLINGIVFKADSIEEMAEKMGVPSVILKKTLDKYNESYEKGYDADTGRRVFAQRIEKPPFYFGRETIYVHTTLDGIRTDDKARALTQSGNPMPGLFAAGEVVGGIFGKDRLGGAGMTNCLVMGREAGRNAARNASVS